ncbi:MAG TPA: polymer-forming cytoskeletal protein [Leucothrix mucor]|uniref:Polymer-forming cytoskeletal protein n=1 Tax=Leucothrix mucor TaxID=45248 RepID=A0A7V2T443_LEUMU|nr:polymer-forming cytoskeletal protein [Leucothrix mucor]
MIGFPKVQKDDLQYSILRKDTKLTGDLFFSGRLHVFGSITGNIISTEDADSTLVLEQGSEINGEIRAGNILVHTLISGDIFAYKRLSLKATAIIQGDVHYQELEMEQGATINGNLSALNKEKPNGFVDDS